MIDRYDGDEKKQVNLLAGRINHDIGERTVVGAMGLHKHQADRDVRHSYRSMDDLDCIKIGQQRRNTLSIGLMARCTGRTTPPRNGLTKAGWVRRSLKRFRTAFAQTRWGSKRKRFAVCVLASDTDMSFQRRVSWNPFGWIHVIFIRPMPKDYYGNG